MNVSLSHVPETYAAAVEIGKGKVCIYPWEWANGIDHGLDRWEQSIVDACATLGFDASVRRIAYPSLMSLVYATSLGVPTREWTQRATNLLRRWRNT